MRGCTGSHSVLRWSLSGTLGSYKGLQYRVRGLAGSQGTVQWSLDGSMGPHDVLRCCSLSDSRGSYGIFEATRGAVQIVRVLLNNGL